MTDSPQPRLSASVILLREAPAEDRGFEVFLLKRNDGSGFMPGRFVFPGGGLEKSDGAGEEGLRRCAIRELWEEAGILLARGGEAVADRALLAAGRKRMEQKGLGLEESLAEMGLEPDLEALVPFARWITPKARPKRFDTWFYLAPLPQGQEAEPDQQETTEGVWLTPDQALEENNTGRVGLAPPQVRILGELAAHTSLDRLLSQTRGKTPREPVEPVMWIQGKERIILLPWDKDHQAGRPVSQVEPCPAGECSRLVHDRGRWRPFVCCPEGGGAD